VPRDIIRLADRFPRFSIGETSRHIAGLTLLIAHVKAVEESMASRAGGCIGTFLNSLVFCELERLVRQMIPMRESANLPPWIAAYLSDVVKRDSCPEDVSSENVKYSGRNESQFVATFVKRKLTGFKSKFIDIGWRYWIAINVRNSEASTEELNYDPDI
jgi:hypothetical protein